MSHEEVNDLVRFAPTPWEGAKRVLSFAENVGSEDNATVIVVPLLGWGKPQGTDTTKELREYKQSQAGKSVPVPLPRGRYLTRMPLSRTEKNVIILSRAVVLVGQTGCTLCIPYSIHRPLFNTLSCNPAVVEDQDTQQHILTYKPS